MKTTVINTYTYICLYATAWPNKIYRKLLTVLIWRTRQDNLYVYVQIVEGKNEILNHTNGGRHAARQQSNADDGLSGAWKQLTATYKKYTANQYHTKIYCLIDVPNLLAYRAPPRKFHSHKFFNIMHKTLNFHFLRGVRPLTFLTPPPPPFQISGLRKEDKNIY